MKKISFVLMLILFAAAVISCEDDDVCVGEGTPRLTVVFRNSLGTENQADTLTIISALNPDFGDADTLYWKTYTDSIKLPLSNMEHNKTYFRIQRRSNLNADLLTVNYNSEAEYVSKACGFRIIYHDLNYAVTHNYIEQIEGVDPNVLENEFETNLYIRLSD